MSFLESLEQLSISKWVSESPSVFGYATVLLLHVMGMAIVVGLSSVISLRLISGAPRSELQPLVRLYPLLWFGFVINATTGTALMLASASTKLIDPTFYLKMVFIFVGVTVVQRLRTQVFHSPSPSDPLPASTKTLAWTALICWLGAVTAGRLLAYI